jgi:hypothetical protein
MYPETYVMNQQEHVYSLLKTVAPDARVTQKMSEIDLKSNPIIEYTNLQGIDKRFETNKGLSTVSFIADIYSDSDTSANSVAYSVCDDLIINSIGAASVVTTTCKNVANFFLLYIFNANFRKCFKKKFIFG